jgi:hypothetical protein
MDKESYACLFGINIARIVTLFFAMPLKPNEFTLIMRAAIFLVGGYRQGFGIDFRCVNYSDIGLIFEAFCRYIVPD